MHWTWKNECNLVSCLEQKQEELLLNCQEITKSAFLIQNVQRKMLFNTKMHKIDFPDNKASKQAKPSGKCLLCSSAQVTLGQIKFA